MKTWGIGFLCVGCWGLASEALAREGGRTGGHHFWWCFSSSELRFLMWNPKVWPSLVIPSNSLVEHIFLETRSYSRWKLKVFDWATTMLHCFLFRGIGFKDPLLQFEYSLWCYLESCGPKSFINTTWSLFFLFLPIFSFVLNSLYIWCFLYFIIVDARCNLYLRNINLIFLLTK
jgi:hypothetical protein